MSESLEAKQIDVVHALRDVMEIITSYADMKSLNVIEKVCTSWRDEALREKAKRSYIQLLQLHLPYQIGNLNKTLGSNPCVSLLFYRGFCGCGQEINQNLLEESMKKLTHKAIALRFQKCLTTEVVQPFEAAERNSGLELRVNGDVLGLFFHNMMRRARVHVACVSSRNHSRESDYDAEVNEFMHQLGLSDCDYNNSTLILFTNNSILGYQPKAVARRLLARLHARNQIMLMSTWNIIPINFEDNSSCLNDGRYSLAALSIIGPNVESWTASIHRRSSFIEIHLKLRELKRRVKHRRECIGLIYGFSCADTDCDHSDHPAGDSEKIMRILKLFFPDVQFVGSFGRTDFNKIANNLFDWCGELDFLCRMLKYMRIMIISYD